MAFLIKQTIEQITGNHALSPVTDYCKVEDANCRLKSGHEVTFISLLSEQIFQRLKNSTEEYLFYNQWVYMPSRRAEEKIGYDLSIGKYDCQKRVRTMNKLLLSWCDNRRAWSFKRGGKDHNHFVRLYNDWAKSEDSKDSLTAYLVINICYCIHEFRRMGLILEGYNYRIPGFDSLLRTLIVPLTPIFILIQQEEINPQNISFKYNRLTNSRLPNENEEDFLRRISKYENHNFKMSWNNNSIKIEIISLNTFLESSINFLLGH